MSKQDRSVKIGGDAKGNVIQTGDNNKANLTYQEAPLPPPESVDIHAEVAALKELLSALNAPDQRKINNAFEDAEEELEKDEPDKDEVSQALERAAGYAQRAEDFAEVIEKFKPHAFKIAAWLGAGGTALLTALMP